MCGSRLTCGLSIEREDWVQIPKRAEIGIEIPATAVPLANLTKMSTMFVERY